MLRARAKLRLDRYKIEVLQRSHNGNRSHVKLCARHNASGSSQPPMTQPITPSPPQVKPPMPPPPPPPPKQGGGGVLGKLFGLSILATGGVMGYAWYDPNFKELLQSNIPYSKEAFSYTIDQLPSAEKVLGDKKSPAPVDDTPKGLAKPIVAPVAPTKPALPSTTAQPETAGKTAEPVEDPAAKRKREEAEKKARIARELKEKKEAEEAQNKALESTLSSYLVDAESAIQQAVESEQSASSAIREHSAKLKAAMDTVDGNMDKETEWRDVTAANEVKAKAVPQAVTHTEIARSRINRLRDTLKSARDDKVTKKNRSINDTEKTLNKLEYELQQAEAKTKRAQTESRLIGEYRDLIREGRENFQKELESIMPDVQLAKSSEDKLTEDELNSLIAHAHRRIEQMQRRLAEQQALEQARMDRALDRQREEDNKLTEEAVLRERQRCHAEADVLLSEQEHSIAIKNEAEIRHHLARQAAAHSEHLTDVLRIQEANLHEKYNTMLHERVVLARDEMRQEIAGSVTKLKGLEQAIEARAEAEKRGRKAQELWLACQSLQTSITEASAEINDVKPLAAEVEAIRTAGDGHPFVSAVIAAVPSTSVERGVYTQEQLTDRFVKVRRVCRRVGMIDEKGGSLIKYAMSYLQSMFIMKASRIITDYDQELQASDINTFSLLDNAAYCLERGDLEQALRFMNQLTGQPRYVASDWIKEARLLLETKQASDALLAHASANGLGSLF